MCSFFSFCSTPEGVYLYFDHKERKKIISGDSKYTDTDSHISIADFYGYCGAKEDLLNKFEYNPLLGEFRNDMINGDDNSKEAERWVRGLDFGNIVPKLIIKEIVNPFEVEVKLREEHVLLLEMWNSVRNSVRNSVWDFVGNSVRNSVRNSVWNSVKNSVKNSVCNSVGDSVRASVWASVGDSVRVYTSSFVNIDYSNNFSCLVKLWEFGFVPSFDGDIWRLHSRNGIEWKGKFNELIPLSRAEMITGVKYDTLKKACYSGKVNFERSNIKIGKGSVMLVNLADVIKWEYDKRKNREQKEINE